MKINPKNTVMKKLFTLFAMAITTLLLTPQTSQASHMAGTDITYEYTGVPNTYLVRVKYYRDCLGIPAINQINICWSSSSLGLSGSAPAPKISFSAVPNTPCVTAPANCPGGVGDIEEHIFEAVITLQQPASDWVFSFSECCRNAAISTLANPGGLNMYNSCTLDNLTAPTNSSPYFLNLAYTRFCVGNQFFYDQGAIDIDGDSLVFSLVTAEDGGGCAPNPIPCPYVAPYSPLNPLSSSIPITINSATGVINFIPSLQQVAVICVLVREYRNGLLIGQVKRDIQINIVAACNQIIPSFNNGVLTAGGGQLIANCNDYSVILPFDTNFQCGSAVPTDFRAVTPFGVPNPLVSVVPINCSNGQTDSLLVTFLNPLTVGETFVWVKRGFDGNTLLSECGAEIVEFADTVRILVSDNSVWSPVTDSVGCIFNQFSVTLSDSIYCFSVANDGTDLQLVDGSGNNFPIANAYGYCNPGGAKTNQLLVNMAASSSSTGPLYLLLNNSGGSDGNTLANDCGRFLTSTDTLAIFFVDNVIVVNLGSDQNICSFDPIPTLDCGYPNLNYQWYDQSGAIAGATSQTYTPTVSGTYSVAINNGPGCTGADTMTLVIIPAPSDNLGNDLVLCVNDPLPILDAGNVGATYQWYLNSTAIAGATSQTYTPSGLTPGTYTFSVEVNTGNVICIGLFDVVITTTPAFNVNLSNQSICDITAAYPLLDAGNPGAPSYQWFLNSTAIAGATGQTYQTMQGGTYSVQVGTGTCAGNGNMVLTVTATPVVTLTNATICDYDVIPTLDAGTVSNATYQWLNGGTAIGGATNSTYTPTAAGSYSVDVTVPPGCTGSGNMTLTINAAPVLSVLDQDICSDGLAILDAGVSGATYTWSNGGNAQTISTGTAGTYTVAVSLNNCTATDTALVTVYYYPVAPIVACNPGTGPYKFIYVWTAIGGVASYEVSEDGGATWIPANTPSGPESHGLNVTIPDFMVRALGNGLCKIGAASEPTACEVIIPNIFTPNGDSQNEFFQLDNIEQYPNNTVQIFNRWGKEVYNEGGYNNSTKKFNGKDLPDGVYFYIVDLGNGVKAKAGTVTINR